MSSYINKPKKSTQIVKSERLPGERELSIGEEKLLDHYIKEITEIEWYNVPEHVKFNIINNLVIKYFPGLQEFDRLTVVHATIENFSDVIGYIDTIIVPDRNKLLQYKRDESDIPQSRRLSDNDDIFYSPAQRYKNEPVKKEKFTHEKFREQMGLSDYEEDARTLGIKDIKDVMSSRDKIKELLRLL